MTTSACPPRREIADLYLRQRPLVFARAKQLLDSEIDAHDVVQEVFIALLDKPEQVRAGDIKTWLYNTTTHLCLNRRRNQATRRRIVEEQVAPTTAREEQPIAEMRAAANEALSRAPSDLARVAFYYYFDELTHAEIAQILGCTRRNVGYLLQRFGQYAI
jgi:RNA polymerase sigma-70 factor, ECF subfamily